jgi:rhamnosyltransferase
MTESTPSVAVLLATHNGARWIATQIASLLSQRDVALKIFASDDQSSDGTERILRQDGFAEVIRILPPLAARLESAAANFQRLIIDVGLQDFDYFAFCDQDDIWAPDHLSHAIHELRANRADACSSSVTAFWPDGSERLVNNAHAQTDVDFIGGGAGQGCTFVLTRRAIRTVRTALLSCPEICRRLAYHDWLTYAVVRTNGLRWIISPKPSLRYRQHIQNHTGVRDTLYGVLRRHRQIASGWYASQIECLLQVLEAMCAGNADLRTAREVLANRVFLDRVRSIPTVMRFRRRWIDAIAFAAYYAMGFISVARQSAVAGASVVTESRQQASVGS